MSQAKKIRNLSLNLLTTQNDLKESIEINGKHLEGIRYHKLYDFLENHEKYTFTSGAISSALQNLPNKVEDIQKIKTDNGVYFILSKYSFESTNIKSIVDSNEYKELFKNAKEVNALLSKILKKASKEEYSNTTNYDLDMLRKIFIKNSELLNLIENYQIEKYILESDSLNKLPF